MLYLQACGEQYTGKSSVILGVDEISIRLMFGIKRLLHIFRTRLSDISSILVICSELGSEPQQASSFETVFNSFDLLFMSRGVTSCMLWHDFTPAGYYMFKVNIRNTRRRCEIWSKLTIKTPERRHWLRSDVFIPNFEHTSHLLLVFLLLALIR